MKQKTHSQSLLKTVLFLAIFGFTQAAWSQVTIGSGVPPHDDALLDLKENNAGTATKGLLLPRVALQVANGMSPLSTHVKGMIVYNTTPNGTGANAVTEGFYYNDGTQWVKTSSGGLVENFWQAASGWSLVGQQYWFAGNIANFVVRLKRTGAGTDVWIANSPMTIAVKNPAAQDAYTPGSTVGSVGCFVEFPGATIPTTAESVIDSNGNIYILNVRESVGTFLNKGMIKTDDEVIISGSYFIKKS
ncbi:hypothetical protein [Dysgonomonas reticulitermitis]